MATTAAAAESRRQCRRDGLILPRMDEHRSLSTFCQCLGPNELAKPPGLGRVYVGFGGIQGAKLNVAQLFRHSHTTMDPAPPDESTQTLNFLLAPDFLEQTAKEIFAILLLTDILHHCDLDYSLSLARSFITPPENGLITDIFCTTSPATSPRKTTRRSVTSLQYILKGTTHSGFIPSLPPSILKFAPVGMGMITRSFFCPRLSDFLHFTERHQGE